MVSVFDIIPNNFFNPLSSNSNYRTNAALLQFIYEQYDNEISYRIKRNILRDELAYYISEHSEELLSDSDMSNKSYQDISSDYLRKFASKDVGWLEEEFDETTFEKYIVITEQGVMLAELLIRLERPEREELSSYMYNIYNTLLNQDQWNGDPYVGALKNVYKNAKALSKSLKKMSTYIRKTIEKIMKEISYESLTDNIIAYCDGDFIKEYARLTKPQNNIHIYRGKIITMLDQMQNDDDMYELITIGCVNEEDIEEWEAQEKIDLMFETIKKFLKDDYLRIIADIKHKLNLYITMALGRLRYLKNHEVDMRGHVERTLKYMLDMMTEAGLKEELPNQMSEMILINQNKYIDAQSIRMPQNRKRVRQQSVTEIETLTEEDLYNLKKVYEKEAKNPYSKKITKQYIKTYTEMAIEYQFDENRTATLNQLMSAYITNNPSGGSQISGLQGSLTPQEISNITDKISNPTQKAVASFVLSKVGYPYSQPLRNSGKAFDCSSLAYYAWKSAGVDILFGGGTTAAAEAEELKYKTVKEENLQPGDLIFYSYTTNGRYKNISHVGIYVGNGKMVEAVDEAHGVCLGNYHNGGLVMICRPKK